MGRSVVVPVATESTGSRLGHAIRAALEVGSLDLQVIDLGSGTAAPAVEVVAREIGMEERPEDLSHLAEWAREALGIPHVLELDGLDTLSDEGREEWLEFVGKWSSTVRTRGDGRPPRPAFLLRSFAPLKVDSRATGPRLLVRRAWALVTASERFRLVESAGIDRPEEEMPRQGWRQHVLPPLLAGDLDLAEVLWDRLGTLSEVLEALQNAAAQRGWSAERATVWLNDLVSRQGQSAVGTGFDEDGLARFWAEGLGDLTRDEGFQISSALFAQAGARAEIKHRYWSGQVSLLLPFLDRFRLRLCRELTDALGADWVTLVPPLLEEEHRERLSDPLATEFGHIEEAISGALELRRFQHLLPLLRDVRWTRNEIAHYRPISYGFYRELSGRVNAAAMGVSGPQRSGAPV
ncbi:MAG: hypothetical protein K8J08_19335 [Thermoanaerobaculia bacterium]|nr:hypothetical protein [Thermoanaerobaculia bacterium]